MAATDSRKPQRPTLHDGIEELESLLGDRRASPAAQVPILDELAETATARSVEPPAAPAAPIDPRQLAELARRLEQRVERELADLSGVIQGVVKRCILEELRSFLPPAKPAPHGGQEPPPPADGSRALD